jgi:glycosyltransferase involved in cell wall biosynthesis
VKIVFLTPGTGSYYCGACLRDNMLARELLRRGHDVSILPMYLPLQLDDTTLPDAARTPVFFGGINVYLQQKFSLFRRTPAWFDRLLNSTGLLRWAARHSHMTSARDHGEMTLQMLDVASSPLRKESDKLFSWLETVGRPDLVCLSTTLLAGFAPEIRRRLGRPVLAFYQGEDSFLDGLPDPWRTRSWTAMAARLTETDALLSPSQFYADFMRTRLGREIPAAEIVPNGVTLAGFSPAPAPPEYPTIGYLARLIPDKGLGQLVDAFLYLARDLGHREARLKIAGAATAGDEPYIAALRRRLEHAGLADRVSWHPNLDLGAKVAFLRSLSVFSVPVVYREAFGLYLIEAMACGVPVVQPAASAFPEILHHGGGELVPPQDPPALARAWAGLLADEPRRAALGAAARTAVERYFSAAVMADRFLATAHRLVPAP